MGDEEDGDGVGFGVGVGGREQCFATVTELSSHSQFAEGLYIKFDLIQDSKVPWMT